MKIVTTFVVFTLFTLFTCAASPASPSQKGLAQKNLAAGKAFMVENRKKEGVIELPNGLQYRVINAGSGPKPEATDTVSVHYRGTLIDGSEFESSARTGKPASFRLDSVIKGLQEALPNMSQGSKWQIVIPPELGYGEQGAGGRIGPNETMVFDIELVAISTTKDNRILAGGTQTAAAREAERKARERKAGSGKLESQPSVDRNNTRYTVDCGRSVPIKVDVRNGHGDGPPDSDYSSGYIVRVEAVTRPQDLTGDGKPETAVLLYCSPQPSNFYTTEIQIFGSDNERVGVALTPPDLHPEGLYNNPIFDQQKFSISGRHLVTGTFYYGPEDCHACGPSIYHVLRWKWIGNQFLPEAGRAQPAPLRAAAGPSPPKTDPPIAGCAVINNQDYSPYVTLVGKRQNHLNRGQEGNGYAFSKDGSLTYQGQLLAHNIPVGAISSSEGDRWIYAQSVALSPKSPSGRFAILQACEEPDFQGMCWALFVVDHSRKGTERTSAGRYGGELIAWVQAVDEYAVFRYTVEASTTHYRVHLPTGESEQCSEWIRDR